jgi:ubiquinone biosynthesis protein
VIAKMVFEDGFFHADPHPGNIIMIGPEDAPVKGSPRFLFPLPNPRFR